jgi:hypothetical protein
MKKHETKILKIMSSLEELKKRLDDELFKNMRPTEISKIEERLGRIASELTRLDNIVEVMTTLIAERVIDQQKDEAIRLDIINGLSRAQVVNKHKIGHSHLKYKTEISGHVALTSEQLKNFKDKSNNETVRNDCHLQFNKIMK